MRALTSTALSSFVMPNEVKDLLLGSRPATLTFAALALFFVVPSLQVN